MSTVSKSPGFPFKIIIIPSTNFFLLLSVATASENCLENVQPPIENPKLNEYFFFASFNAPRFPLIEPIGFSKSALILNYM